MKKMMRKVTGVMLTVAMAFTLTGCGGGYKDYQSAYQKMSAPGSLDTDISLELVTSEKTVTAEGNMKMNKDGAMYYEMTVGQTKVIQFTKDGTLYCDMNGQKSKYSTSGETNEKQPEEGGTDMKQNQSGFDISAFMEEFATLLEAGKIKDMGLLDPIPQSAIKSIQSESDSSGTKYTLEVPDTFVENLFNVMIKEQVSSDDYALSFSDLKDFTCVMHVNSDGILDGMTYSGNTDVTVPSALTGSDEEVINMDITLKVTINNPGTDITVPEMSTEGY